MTDIRSLNDPIKILELDHKKQLDLINELLKTTEKALKTRSKLFSQLVLEIKLHLSIFSEVCEPKLKKRDHELTKENKQILKALGDLPNETDWSDKFNVFVEHIRNHIQLESKCIEELKSNKQILDKLLEEIIDAKQMAGAI